MSRLDSKLEAPGAEFLVLGHLLIEGIAAYRAYDNYPGYDVIATLPRADRAARIQVKSRWATDFDGGFLIKNFDCDFVACVALNRGIRYGRKREGMSHDGRAKPDIYVLPVNVMSAARYQHSAWGKVFLKQIPEYAKYLDNWGLVRDFLESPLSDAEIQAARQPRITSVRVVYFPAVEVAFDDDVQGILDLADIIATGEVFAPVRDPEYFQKVAVSEFGHSIGWNLAEVGREIDIGADTLRARLEAATVKAAAETHRAARRPTDETTQRAGNS